MKKSMVALWLNVKLFQVMTGIFALLFCVLFWSAALFSSHTLPVWTSAAPSVSKQTETVQLPILMYHHILKEEHRHGKYTISPQDFENDLAYLKNQGYTCILTEDLLRFVNDGVPLPEKPVMITFDDGYESFFVYAYPLLEKYDAKAVFSVVGKYTDQYSQKEDHHVAYSHCTWQQLYQMQSSGRVEIQNHSYDFHTNDGSRKGSKRKPGESMDAYRTAFTQDVGKLQNQCQAYLGKAPTAFTYPFGYIHGDTLSIIKEMGFQGAFTCEEKMNVLTGDKEQLYHLRRVNRPHGKTAQEILLALTCAPQ